MGAKTVEELKAYQLTRSFKLEVYRLIRSSPEALRNLRFRSQLYEALSGAESNIGEGFRRWVAPEFAHFLAYVIASIQEGQTRLQDGIDRKYFKEAECARARQLGEVARRTTVALQTSLRKLAEENRRRRKNPKDPGPKDPGPKDPGPKGPGPKDPGPRT